MSQHGTSILFGLRGVRVREVVRCDVLGRVVHLLTDDETAAACPQCGVLSTTVRQRRTTRPRDLPQGEELLVVRWHKVQWSCREKPCPRKAFTSRSRSCRPAPGSPAGYVVTSLGGSRTGWRSASPATA